jgi:hypothetical protein
MSSVEFPPVTSFLYTPKIKTEITVITLSGNIGTYFGCSGEERDGWELP